MENDIKFSRFKTLLLHFDPTRVIVVGFLCVIVFGTLLLSLPIASSSGESTNLVDALFTATSAVCVTGLVVVNTFAHWSAFGKVVIIILIQVGGLGFMTVLTMFFLLKRKKITFRERILIQESLNQDTVQGIVRLVKSIIFGTFLIEGVGALLLIFRFSFDYGFLKAIPLGIFHAISSFCNAGFDILGFRSLVPYATDPIINYTIIILIVLGGLGFSVWVDIASSIKIWISNKTTLRYALGKMRLHSKIVLLVTPILLFGGMLLIFLFEYKNNNTIGTYSFFGKMTASLMQSTTARTCGYDGLSQMDATYATQFLTIVLMFIGGSPAGTAGGIKTVTFAILILSVISVTRGRQSVNLWHKKIPLITIQKALAIFFISLGVVIGITMLLTVTERGMIIKHEFMDLLFETVSALGTTGLTVGITPYLSVPGRLLISLAMFMGRLGPISIMIALTRRQAQYEEIVECPEENVMVG